VFSASGEFVRAFGNGVNPAGGDVCTTACEAGDEGGSAGVMVFPQDVALDGTGNVYVADHDNNRIDVFTSAGEFVRAFGWGVNNGGAALQVCTAASACQAGGEDGSAGAVISPSGVDVDGSGHLYIADIGNHRIDVFSTAGDFVRAFGKEVDPGGGDICTGECQSGLLNGSAGALAQSTALAADSSGALYVSDTLNSRFAEFEPEGKFLRALGEGVFDGSEASRNAPA
jgi:DNA-binding beta-propeller fold protein YncE